MEGNTIWDGWGSVILVVSTIITFMLVFGLVSWQALRIWQASVTNRAAIAHDNAYRKLVEETAEAQKQLVEKQDRIANEVGQVRQSLAGIERVLKQVE